MKLAGSLLFFMDKFIKVRSKKIPILPGEKEELVNEGMYGKALAQYLQEKLSKKDYNVPFFCCEDWGWWVEIKDLPFTFGVCIYCQLEDNESDEPGTTPYFFCTNATTGEKIWSWKKFRFIDPKPWVEKLHEDLVHIFQNDSEVELLGTSIEDPFG